jgi:hypothetical protein
MKYYRVSKLELPLNLLGKKDKKYLRIIDKVTSSYKDYQQKYRDSDFELGVLKGKIQELLNIDELDLSGEELFNLLKKEWLLLLSPESKGGEPDFSKAFNESWEEEAHKAAEEKRTCGED